VQSHPLCPQRQGELTIAEATPEPDCALRMVDGHVGGQGTEPDQLGRIRYAFSQTRQVMTTWELG
jgi:hypothetical protein